MPKAKRALLADDDPTLRMVLGQLLSLSGFDVTYAENGKIALDMFDNTDNKFDLLVTDICMPEMNGKDLIHEIRGRNQKLTIIAVTGYVEPELIDEIESCHVRLFLKPINFKALHDHINSLFNT